MGFGRALLTARLSSDVDSSPDALEYTWILTETPSGSAMGAGMLRRSSSGIVATLLPDAPGEEGG